MKLFSGAIIGSWASVELKYSIRRDSREVNETWERAWTIDRSWTQNKRQKETTAVFLNKSVLTQLYMYLEKSSRQTQVQKRATA